MRPMKKTVAVAATLAAVSLTAACGGDADETSGTTTEETPSQSESPTDEGMDEGMDPAANLVGPGCADYAEAVPDGAGSVQGMAQDPVAVAASNNPMLKTLVAAVSGELNPDVNLVDTLNGDEFTVFAPTDDAFAKIDAATIDALKKDADLLTTILTYHVVPGQIAPDQIAGKQTTVQGGTVRVKGSGDDLTVDAAGSDAQVVCGGVMTANATVYMVDTVLLPQM